ncbi:hypothetical protein GGQ03_002351 [Salinibacter ruber]|uniref:hypothetical protein n=1 Tax=Salinibacter ruber TaxID=146919 RepID=UPI002168BC13|nr:hypothetical protein [Salinibacter ruber]MCS4155057.1 hypothetical protein [Salinibacter ruber]
MSPDSLQNFVEGLSEKIGSEFGRVSTHEGKREVKREIARELGVEDEYILQIQSSVTDSDASRRARWEVRRRYRELRSEGKIVEAGEVAEQTKRFREWNEQINAHLRGEECFYSEDLPHADWVQGGPSSDPGEGV